MPIIGGMNLMLGNTAAFPVHASGDLFTGAADGAVLRYDAKDRIPHHCHDLAIMGLNGADDAIEGLGGELGDEFPLR